MIPGRKRRDNNLIDAIEAIEPIEYADTVWRIVRQGREPTRCSRSGGRWDDGTFDVLYTSQTREGAVAELRFHLMRGQPVIPSLVKFHLFELEISLRRALKFLDMAALQAVGLDTSRYGHLSYNEKHAEYPRSQDIAEVAHFLDFDGLIVPSVRHECMNVVVFCDKVLPEDIAVKNRFGNVKW